MSAIDPGLCGRCRHQRVVPTTRGSSFSLCRRSEQDPGYPRYPRLPVLRCPGFEEALSDGDAGRPRRGARG